MLDQIAKFYKTESEIPKKCAKSATPVKLSFKNTNLEKQIVYGEVYAPDVVDSHGDAMNADEIEKLAHAFLAKSLNANIDIMHDNKPVKASVVESFVADGHNPLYAKGSWVLGTKIYDADLWEDIKKGVYNGYSMEVMVRKNPKTVEVNIQNHIFGFVEENDGHSHAFYVKMNDEGKVVGGGTSEDEGHSHEISLATATNKTNDHSHRFFLP
jgi:hypothetical protein